jgi:hypothetical protein
MRGEIALGRKIRVRDLGSYPAYTETADLMGAKAFNVGKFYDVLEFFGDWSSLSFPRKMEVGGFRRPLIEPAGNGVSQVSPAPAGLRLLSVRRPTPGFPAHPLPRPYSRIRTEPLSADTAGLFPEIGHR